MVIEIKFHVFCPLPTDALKNAQNCAILTENMKFYLNNHLPTPIQIRRRHLSCTPPLVQGYLPLPLATPIPARDHDAMVVPRLNGRMPSQES